MASPYEEAPALPHTSTDPEIVVDPMSNVDSYPLNSIASSGPTSQPPPPPKFPSLTDVALPNAQAAAAATAAPYSEPYYSAAPSFPSDFNAADPQSVTPVPFDPAQPTSQNPPINSNPVDSPFSVPPVDLGYAPVPSTDPTYGDAPLSGSTYGQQPQVFETPYTGPPTTEIPYEEAPISEPLYAQVPVDESGFTSVPTSDSMQRQVPPVGNFSANDPAYIPPDVAPVPHSIDDYATDPYSVPPPMPDVKDTSDPDQSIRDEEIDQAIRRDAVEPGTGARLIHEIGAARWTQMDQQELDRLLAEGQDVYVPPDVEESDLPVPPSSGYSYKPVPPVMSGVDDSPYKRSMAERIADWNQVISAKGQREQPVQSVPVLVPVAPPPESSARTVPSTIIPDNSVIPGSDVEGATTDDAVIADEPFNEEPIVDESPTSYEPQVDTPDVVPMPLADNFRNVEDEHDVDDNVFAERDGEEPEQEPEIDPIHDESDVDEGLFLERAGEEPPHEVEEEPIHDDRVVDDRAFVEPIVMESQPEPQPNPELEVEPEPEPDEVHAEHPKDVVSKPMESSLQVQEPVDVSRTIFGGTFLTVPVTSNNPHVETGSINRGSKQTVDGAKMHDVRPHSEPTAKIDVSKDFGLKGGHESIVHDAVFLNGKDTLVTCGSDGKVCIWDMNEHCVKREFIPYEGESVTMVYPLPDEDREEGDEICTLITLSKSRWMRIWLVDDKQAVMLRNSKINESESDLYMTVTSISKELKARAAAAAAAAAVRTSDSPIETIRTGTAPNVFPDEIEEPAPAVHPTLMIDKDPSPVVEQTSPVNELPLAHGDQPVHTDESHFYGDERLPLTEPIGVMPNVNELVREDDVEEKDSPTIEAKDGDVIDMTEGDEIEIDKRDALDGKEDVEMERKDDEIELQMDNTGRNHLTDTPVTAEGVIPASLRATPVEADIPRPAERKPERSVLDAIEEEEEGRGKKRFLSKIFNFPRSGSHRAVAS